MRQMGEAATVPIEPPEQTKLLDVCVNQAGVIGGGVPGGKHTEFEEPLYTNNLLLQRVATMQSGYWSRIQ